MAIPRTRRNATPPVAAVLQRFAQLSPLEQLRAFAHIRQYLSTEPGEIDRQLDERQEALELLTLVAAELRLAAGVAPTTRQVDCSKAARDRGWNATRVRRAFGRYSFAVDSWGGRRRPSAAQRTAQRSARGALKEREDYLRGIKVWLESAPTSTRTTDYDSWRQRHNDQRSAADPYVVSYSMLRKAFDCRWRDLIRVARGELTIEEAPTRVPRRQSLARPGPDDLVAFGDVQKLLGLGITAARNRTYEARFPKPAYTHPRGNHMRLWRRSDINRYVAGTDPREPSADTLRGRYVDAHAVADRLGLAMTTVTTRSSPLVPQPAVLLGGLQLWRIDQFQF